MTLHRPDDDELLDALLRTAAGRLEEPPPGLVERIEAGLDLLEAARRRRRRLLVSGAAALAIVLGLSWALREAPPGPAPVPGPVAKRASPVRVRFDPASPAISIPLETRNPAISIVRVYLLKPPSAERETFAPAAP